ncbi:MAG: DUF2062 domain-containing protein [Syntrophorhabdus sp.]|mgnify:FL=1|nr:DUF2062 domain-containing protein [Syntrophorhabdus sp.]
MEKERPVRVLVVIPVYNNPDTLPGVVKESLAFHSNILVIDDGSLDRASDLLESPGIRIVRHERNRGKGAAILTAACVAQELGMTHVITIDADGQHSPDDIPRIISAINETPDAIIVGNRDFDKTVPFSSRFGRQFSNFWIRIQTGTSLNDTQSGFRAYPVALLRWLTLREKRFSFEVEVLVKALWAGIEVREIPVSVYYPAREERVSHFHALRDNLSLSILHARLTIRSFLPIPHRRFMPLKDDMGKITALHPVRSLRTLLIRHSSPEELAMSSGLGVLLSCLPLIACQTITILFAASFFRFNKFAALGAGQLCMPPIVPAVCIEVGYYIRHGRFLTEVSFQTLGYQGLERILEWFIGSLVVGPILGLVIGVAVYILANLLKHRKYETA